MLRRPLPGAAQGGRFGLHFAHDLRLAQSHEIMRAVGRKMQEVRGVRSLFVARGRWLLGTFLSGDLAQEFMHGEASGAVPVNEEFPGEGMQLRQCCPDHYSSRLARKAAVKDGKSR